MKKILLFSGLIVIGILGFILLHSSGVDEYRNTQTATSTLEREGEDILVFKENLSVPWGITFLPDGNLILTERTGTLLRLDETGRTVASIEIPGITDTGEGGLLGVTTHPNFEANQQVYLYETYTSGGGIENRVVRYVLQNNELTEEEVIIESIPGAPYHDGGRIEFGPDNYLYITTGDAGQESLAQNLNSLAGKILRVDEDGGIPQDNPFTDSAHGAVYSYGHRNPQGLAWDDEGQLWSTEHGPSGSESGHDELNLIVPGGNYGWPLYEGETERSSRGDRSREDFEFPVVESGENDTWAPASLAYYQGSFYWGGLRGQALYRAERSGEGVSAVEEHLQTYGRIRSVHVGPDDYLYITTSNTDGRGSSHEGDDRVIRVNPDIFQ